ncbi:MAG: hypothetical protein GH149_04205 [Methanosarcinales archaeon]|nr:hypothetical protein [Methanosarcinales archaeon]
MRIRAVLIVLVFLTMLFYPVAAEPRPTVMITDYNVYPEVWRDDKNKNNRGGF